MSVLEDEGTRGAWFARKEDAGVVEHGSLVDDAARIALHITVSIASFVACAASV